MHQSALLLLGLVFSGVIIAISSGLAAAFAPVLLPMSCTTRTRSELDGVLHSQRDTDSVPQSSASASPDDPNGPSVTRQERREAILSILQRRSRDGSTPAEWHKLRNYLYQTNLSTLPLNQVESVISYLDSALDSTDLTNTVLQNTPRILRKSVETQLMPTVEFLQSIYPQELFLKAVERRPNLLVTSGVGYNRRANSDTNNDAEQYLLKELRLPDTAVAKLKRSTPVIFQFSVLESLRPVVEYLVSILASGNETADIDIAARAEAMTAVGKLVRSYPTVLGLSVETNLKPTVQLLLSRCNLHNKDMAKILKSYPEFLGLSLETNLRPKIDYISNVLLDYIRDGSLPEDEVEEEYALWLEDAQELLRSCIIRHPPILGLAIDNLRRKVAYFDAVDCAVSVDAALDMMRMGSANSAMATAKSKGVGKSKAAASLAGRILLAAPSTYSLNLEDNIVPTVQCLAKFWGTEAHAMIDIDGDRAIRDENGCLFKALPTRSNALSSQLREYPAVLTLSIEGNLRPTIEFYNKTGYVHLDSGGRLIPNEDRRRDTLIGGGTVRGRYLATSLYNRLLPRWHYFQTQIEANSTGTNNASILGDPLCDIDGSTGMSDEQCVQEEQLRPPLHLLAGSSDQTFCAKYGFALDDYEQYRRVEGGKLKFNTQFANWIKTGRPID